MAFDVKNLPDYIESARFLVLATADEGGPVQRTLGGFGNEGTTVYFSTHQGSRKVQQIARDPHVSLLVQHEKQELPTFVNVAIRGTARRLRDSSEIAKAIERISARSQNFRERAARGELGETALFRVDPTELRVIDFSGGIGPKAVTVIPLGSSAAT
jgi:nitroimidazol reductase NimA-like FMN-containing flavoprotein (pyridoxamine 5'-phosphate oxidase superfamily)